MFNMLTHAMCTSCDVWLTVSRRRRMLMLTLSLLYVFPWPEGVSVQKAWFMLALTHSERVSRPWMPPETCSPHTLIPDTHTHAHKGRDRCWGWRRRGAGVWWEDAGHFLISGGTQTNVRFSCPPSSDATGHVTVILRAFGGHVIATRPSRDAHTQLLIHTTRVILEG